ncbi:hypothetical protein LXL04_028269 [Taraxacum kok-saghyz]
MEAVIIRIRDANGIDWSRHWDRLESRMGSIAEIGDLDESERFCGDWERRSRLFERIWYLCFRVSISCDSLFEKSSAYFALSMSSLTFNGNFTYNPLPPFFAYISGKNAFSSEQARLHEATGTNFILFAQHLAFSVFTTLFCQQVENLKALLEIESQVPLQQQQLLYNGKEMGNAETLSRLGVTDGDLVMMVSTPFSSSSRLHISSKQGQQDYWTEGQVWDFLFFFLLGAVPVFQVLAVLLPSGDRAARDAVWCLSAAVAAYVGLVNHIIYKDDRLTEMPKKQQTAPEHHERQSREKLTKMPIKQH